MAVPDLEAHWPRHRYLLFLRHGNTVFSGHRVQRDSLPRRWDRSILQLSTRTVWLCERYPVRGRLEREPCMEVCDTPYCSVCELQLSCRSGFGPGSLFVRNTLCGHG